MFSVSNHGNITYRCVKICHTVLEEQVSDAVTKTTNTPTKTSGQKSKSVKKELPKAKHSHGNFISSLHYVKLFTTVKNVYTVYQVMSHDLM